MKSRHRILLLKTLHALEPSGTPLPRHPMDEVSFHSGILKNQTQRPNQTLSNQESGIGIGAAIAILISSAIVILIVAITAAVGCRLKSIRNQENISKTDENVDYGMYSRGWEGEGDYGDGDKVYVTDTNDYYG